MNLKIRDVRFSRGQRGWSCEIGFNITTASQFTDVYRSVIGGGRWWFTAFLAARRDVKDWHRVLGAKPGERQAKGWVHVVSFLLLFLFSLPASAANVYDSPVDPRLMAAAQQQAQTQAHACRQGHILPITRLGFGNYAEICAESWPEQVNADWNTLWLGAWHDWMTSPGHRGVAVRRHAAYGYGCARSARGIWYFTICVRD